MAAVRARDGRSRFPMDPCQDYWLEVSHGEHRGMGGNPDGTRTTRQTMILLSRKRHQDHKFSIDRGGLKWTPCTEQGADGPIRWWVNGDFLPPAYRESQLVLEGHWLLLAVEFQPHEYWPLNAEQKELLKLVE